MRIRATNITDRPVIRDTWPTALAPGEARVALLLHPQSGEARVGDPPHLTHLRACRYLRVEVIEDA